MKLITQKVFRVPKPEEVTDACNQTLHDRTRKVHLESEVVVVKVAVVDDLTV